MRWLLLVLLVLLVSLQFQLWFRGMNEVWELQETLAAQQVENSQLKERNAALEAEVNDLKTGQDAIEERARSELGMVKQGEKLIQVAEPGKAAAAAAARAEDEPR